VSRLDEYEHRRGPVRRVRRSPYKASRPKPKEVQIALKLMGGTTAKDKGQPFDDPIPF
jgi:hypothetical protein